MKAVIMAGGKGTRLRPLTSNTPKPMVPLLDRPVMEYTIELLKKHGITEIAVTVQYLPEVIRNYFGDGSDYGVKLHYFEEDSPLGTAGSVKNAEEFLDETFVVISGDALTDFDLTKAIEYHHAKRSVATLVLTQVENPLEFGVVMTDETGSVIRFLEKPCWGEVFSDTVNTGIYVLDTEIFSYFEPGTEFDFSKELFPMLMRLNRPLYGYIADGYWSDIGNLSQYRQAQFDILDGKVDVSVSGTEIAPKVWVGEKVKIGNEVTIEGPAFIGGHCILETGAALKEYSIVGSGSRISRYASLERSVLWRNNYIEHSADLKGATLCHHVIVRSGAMAGEDAVIGDGCHIGVRSIVQPAIKIFPNKIVENHVTVKHSMVWGERVTKQLFGLNGIKGTCNVDITTHFANRIAMALGTTLPLASTVGIGHDGSPFAAIIADALSSGLHASGIHTYAYGAVTSAVSRHAAYRLDCSAGIHIRMLQGEEEDQLVIEFIDQAGLPISKAAERKIENAYYQDDYRMIKASQVGRHKKCTNVSVLYRERMLELTGNNTQGYTVLLEYDHGNMVHIIPELLEALGCKVIQLHRVTSTPSELTEWVKSTRADIGLRLDDNGQISVLVTDQGDLIQEEMLFILQVMTQLQNGDAEKLHVPVNAPNIVELLASQYKIQVVRTKSDPRSIMEGCQENGFHIYWDGLYTLIHIMKLMQEKELKLSQLVDLIPDFALLKEKVDCPWTEKGRVMRFLMEQTKGKTVELIDGIKIIQDSGWTLILPDSEEPIFRVITSGVNQQAAKELAATYTKMIKEYRQKASV
ncbi:sugar phosphate nucleotidyltransferase [Paenibacillus tarimensis]